MSEIHFPNDIECQWIHWPWNSFGKLISGARLYKLSDKIMLLFIAFFDTKRNQVSKRSPLSEIRFPNEIDCQWMHWPWKSFGKLISGARLYELSDKIMLLFIAFFDTKGNQVSKRIPLSEIRFPKDIECQWIHWPWNSFRKLISGARLKKCYK